MPKCLYKGALYLTLPYTRYGISQHTSTDIGPKLIQTEKRLSVNNVNSYHSSRVNILEINKQTVLTSRNYVEQTWNFLLADTVARPARQGPIVDFRFWSVSKDTD
jgi:hypothetical protein